MNDVKVRRDELLAKVKANRDGHRDLFLKAQAGFRQRCIEELDAMLADAREGRKVRMVVGLVEPADHTKDYDRVIRMLEMSTDDIVEIDSSAFAQYVMDEWSWMAAATASNTAYASGGKIYR